MRLILVLFDSLNGRALERYGAPGSGRRSFTRLAEPAVSFNVPGDPVP